jgi:hypothetical protein
MSRFLNATMSDIRNGRETWRVIVALSGPAFVLAVATTVLQLT